MRIYGAGSDPSFSTDFYGGPEPSERHRKNVGSE